MDDAIKFYFGWVVYNLLCLFLFCLILSHNRMKGNQQVKLILTVACIIAIFGNAITMDYRSYWRIIQRVILGSQWHIHLEPIYLYLIDKIGANYILWQACIYIPSYLIMYKIIKYLNIYQKEIFLFVFGVLILYYDCIGSRQFLFIVLYYLGIILVVRKRLLYGFAVLFISYFFHKMAYMALPLLLLYLIPLRERLFKVIIITLVATISVRILLIPFIELISGALEISVGLDYISNEESVSSAGSIWWVIIGKYTHFVRLFLLWFCLYKVRNVCKYGNSIQRIIYAVVFWTSCCSFFFENIGLTNGTIAYRLLSLGSIGFCYLFTLIPEYYRVTKCQRAIFIIAMMGYFILTNAYIKGVGNSVMLGELQLE